MLFFSFIKELKYRIYYCFYSFFFSFIIFFLFSKELLFLMVNPLLQIKKTDNFNYFIFTNMMDVLILYFKLAFILSISISIVVFLFELWFFLVQGLYNYEKNFLYFLLCFFLVLSYFILFLLYSYIIPIIWFFLTNFELTSSNSLFGVYYEARITDYINFMFFIYFVFCCFLQFPLFMFFFIYLNIINIKLFILSRKYLFVIFFILAGFFSPPDILSQIFIGCFSIILYEIVLFLSLIFFKYIG